MRNTNNSAGQEDKKEADYENKDGKEHEMSPKNFIHG